MKILNFTNLAVSCLFLCMMFPAILYSDGRRDSGVSVLYQVTRNDRSVRNQPDPPGSNEGIRMVIKIVRYDSALPGTETVSTGNQQIEKLNPPRIIKTQLKWNGRKWVPAITPERKVARTPSATSATLSLAMGELERVAEELQGEPDKKDLARLEKSLRNVIAVLSLVGKQVDGAGNERHGDQSDGPPATLRERVKAEGELRRGSRYHRGRVGIDGAVDIETEEPNPDYDVGPRVKIREKD